MARLELKGNGLAAERLDLGDDRLRLIGAAVIGEDDAAALASDVDGSISAEAAASAGDERNLSHRPTPFSGSGPISDCKAAWCCQKLGVLCLTLRDRVHPDRNELYLRHVHFARRRSALRRCPCRPERR